VNNNKGHVRRGDPFNDTQLLAVNYPDADDFPRFECYLNDILGAFMECGGARGAAAIPLALHMIRRPHGSGDDESLPRNDVLVMSKFLAEGKPSESNVILGLWVNTTMAFSVLLPSEKYIALRDSIERILARRRDHVPSKTLDRLMG
jgi:hypothetical protein